LKIAFYIVFFILICHVAFAHRFPLLVDTLPLKIEPSTQDTDSLSINSIQDSIVFSFSKDSIDGPVKYTARDSSDLDRGEEKLYLYGEAKIEYESFVIKADIIIVDIKNGTADAIGIKEEGDFTGFCEFTDGQQQVVADRMIYNFRTKRFISYVTRTKESDLYIIAEKSKFVSDDNGKGVFYSRNGVFTTCDAERAHYGIRSSKQKLIPDEVAIVGLSNIEIAEVPTPLILPFGFFPLAKKARKGLIFPSDYESSELWGFGLRNVGYYVPINDYMDAAILADIYLRGSFALTLQNNYKKRYKYTGNTSIAYSYRTQENLLTGRWVPQRSFGINWTHNQDPSANPNQLLNGNLKFQTNNFQNLNFNDANSVLTNTINSNVFYQRRFPGKPYTLSASLAHSQNTQTRIIDVSFPNIDFQMQRIFPFKRKQSGVVKKPSWYEDISLTYNGKFQNSFKNTDTTFFTKSTLDSARLGLQHEANVTSNFRLLKYINVVPNARYREVWYMRSTNRFFDPEIVLNPRDTIISDDKIDTLVRFDTLFGQVFKENINGFRSWRTIDISTSLNTQIFGTIQFKKGPLRGLRHVIKPSVSFNYTPDYTGPSQDYFRRVRRSLLNMDSLFYSVFEDGIFGGPPSNGRQAAINYSFNNIFEGKVRFKKDSADRKFRIMDNVIVNGNYNMAADSFKFSTVNIRGTHRLLKGMTTLTMGLTLDPYALDSNFRRINVLLWQQQKKLLRFQNFNFQLNSTLDVRTIRSWFTGESPNPTKESNTQKLKSMWDIFEDFSINHSFFGGITRLNGRDTFMIGTNNINLTGRMQITEKWRINFGNIGYDFNSKQLTYPDIGFYRDLHCWETGMDWQPQRGTYNFYIRVKPSSLDFLKVPYRKNNVDGLQRL
jgi:hypothetical protein